jgi:hypothetical protein
MQSRSTHRVGLVKLTATSEFGNTRKMAEKRVFELVNSKIDDFLEIADYDWYSTLVFPRYTDLVPGFRRSKTPIQVRICRTSWHS